MASRSLLALGLIASQLAVSLSAVGTGVALAADDVTVDADYSASLSGFPIASGSLQFKLRGQDYDAKLTAQVSGIAALVASRSATGSATGHAEPGHISPDSYSLSISGGSAVNEVAEQFTNNKVVAIAATELNLAGWDKRVPLLPIHKVGVVDPLGAFIIPMKPNKDPLTPDACNRTLKIFDGRVRYDLHLVYGAKSDVTGDASSYSGPAIICAVAYRPIAGQRILPPEVQKFESNIEFSIWFVPVGSTGILLPHRILIQTQSGLLTVTATKFVVHGSDPVVTADATKSPAPDSFVARHHHYRRHKDDDGTPQTKLEGDTKPGTN